MKDVTPADMFKAINDLKKNIRDLTIYSFKSQYLIKNCDSLIIPWYKTFI